MQTQLTTTNAAREAGRVLEAPFNPLHPSYRCPSHPKRPNNGTHKFKEISRVKVRSGIYTSTRQCQYCGGLDVCEMDFNALAGIF